MLHHLLLAALLAILCTLRRAFVCRNIVMLYSAAVTVVSFPNSFISFLLTLLYLLLTAALLHPCYFQPPYTLHRHLHQLLVDCVIETSFMV